MVFLLKLERAKDSVNVSLPETQKHSVELHKEGMNEEAPLHVVSHTVESVGRPWLHRNSRGFSRLPRAILNKTAQRQGFHSNFVSTLLSTLLLQELSSAPRVQATISSCIFLHFNIVVNSAGERASVDTEMLCGKFWIYLFLMEYSN
jgi:hypothetical protein